MLLENGTTLVGTDVLIETFSTGKTKKGGTYFSLQVRDKENSVPCKIWDGHTEMKKYLKPGNVITIWADVSEYQKKPQLVIDRFELSDRNPSDFVQGTRFDVEELWTKVTDVIESFEEPLTKGIAEQLLLSDEVITGLAKKAPAATDVHNNWIGGLLEHIWSMIQLAEPIIAHYKKNYRPTLSRDKVLFGVISHDLGKVIEYNSDNPAFPLTPNGILVNHIVIGPAWVYHASKYLRGMYEGTLAYEGVDWTGETSHLMHLIASHHGIEEWGSPVRPATLEAVLLHFFDNMDSKFMHALALIEKGVGPVEGYSERSYFERTCYKL